MVRDLLEEIAYELNRVHELFVMPAPEYEDMLRNMANELLEYRLNLVEASKKLNEACLDIPENWEHRELVFDALDLVWTEEINV